MKSLALRAFILFALVALAHHIKPFTESNLVTFSRASLHSLTELLPESAVRKASVLAAVVNRTWQQGKTDLPVSANLLAMQKVTASGCECPTKRRMKITNRTAVENNDIAESESEDLTPDGDPAFSLQAGEQSEEVAAETLAQPLPVATPAPTVVPAWTMAPKQRDACDIPGSSDTSESAMPLTPEVAPASERETPSPSQSMPGAMRPSRPTKNELLEGEPIVSLRNAPPANRLRYLLSAIQAARKNAAKC